MLVKKKERKPCKVYCGRLELPSSASLAFVSVLCVVQYALTCSVSLCFFSFCSFHFLSSSLVSYHIAVPRSFPFDSNFLFLHYFPFVFLDVRSALPFSSVDLNECPPILYRPFFCFLHSTCRSCQHRSWFFISTVARLSLICHSPRHRFACRSLLYFTHDRLVDSFSILASSSIVHVRFP